jgi:hypothetical protein
MASVRQDQERQRQREEARRQAARERRDADERERARDEARRTEARQRRLALETERESARLRREALLARIQEERAERMRVAAATSELRERLHQRAVEAARRGRRSMERDRGRATPAIDPSRASGRGTTPSSARDAAARSNRRASAGVARGERRLPPASAAGDPHSRAADRVTAERKDRARREAQAVDRHSTAQAVRLDEARAARLADARLSKRALDRTMRARARGADETGARRHTADAADRARAALAELARTRAGAERREERRVADRRRISDTERTARKRGGAPERRAALKRDERPAIAPSTAPVHVPLGDPIRSGVRSGSLSWLRVEGTRLMTVGGHPVTLRGANVPTLGTDRGPDFGAGPGEAAIGALLALSVTAIRIRVERDLAVGRTGGSGEVDRLAGLDRMIDLASSSGAYTIVSLPTFGDPMAVRASGRRVAGRRAPRIERDAIGVWRAIGERYADEPSVLFELDHTPVRAAAGDRPGSADDWTRWALWIRLLLAELRRIHPRAICLVGGLAMGTDLEGFPILGTANQPIPNLVYAATVSADRPDPPFRALAGRLPLVVTELDVPAVSVPARTAVLAALGIGWIASARPDAPLVAPSRGGRLEPTALGASIRRAIVAIPDRQSVDPMRRPLPSLASVP